MRSRRTRSGASASITEVSSLPAWISGTAASVHRADHRAQMQRAEIEAEVAAQFTAERLQNAAVAAVTVDDQEIARRQRAGDLAARDRAEPPSCRRPTATASPPPSRARATVRPKSTAAARDRRPRPSARRCGRVNASASTVSVLSGRCGPCCSIEPIGRHRIELARSAVPTSWNVRSPIVRLVVGPAMA